MKTFPSVVILASRYLQGDTTCPNNTANACQAHHRPLGLIPPPPRPDELVKVCRELQHEISHDQVEPHGTLTVKSDIHDCNIKFESVKISTSEKTHKFDRGSISFDLEVSGIGVPTANYDAVEDLKAYLQFQLMDGTIDFVMSEVSLHSSQGGWVFGKDVMKKLNIRCDVSKEQKMLFHLSGKIVHKFPKILVARVASHLDGM